MAHQKKTIFRITSRSNPKVKALVKERDTLHFLEGEKLVKDILNEEIPVEILVLDERFEQEVSLPNKRVKETWFVNKTVMDKLSALKESPGFIAVVKLKKKAVNFSKQRLIIGLDNIQDPGNAGTVFRCAAAFDVGAVVFSGPSVKTTNSKFLRTVQNALFDVGFQYFDTLEALLTKASTAGMNVYLTSSHKVGKAVLPPDVRLPALVLLGNEGGGFPEKLLKKYPSVTISQSKKVESLNVGVSACIIMHQLKES
ncbi:MAG: RNA methyltransferase [bacterium]|nr:RNA methyltransferase [bacterium]